MLYGANLLAVRVFGELEFWFALFKVVTIVALIVSGLAVIVFHIGELGADGQLLEPVVAWGLSALRYRSACCSPCRS